MINRDIPFIPKKVTIIKKQQSLKEVSCFIVPEFSKHVILRRVVFF